MWRIAGAGLIGAVGLLFGVQWQPVWVALAGGAGVGATALVSWLLGRRRESGSISTSDAATLWAESQAMRRELREEVVARREEVVHLREDLASAKSEVVGLRGELADTRTELAGARVEIERLRGMLMERPGE